MSSVFSNIRLVSASVIVLFAVTTTSSLAQETTSANAQPQIAKTESTAATAQSASQTSQETNLDTVEQEASGEQVSTQQISTQQTILRLEDTIRGNKEQPQVLTIVPWQLPVHQRINENKEWQLQVKQLSSIERNAFLRNLAVVREIKVANGDTAEPVRPKQALGNN